MLRQSVIKYSTVIAFLLLTSCAKENAQDLFTITTCDTSNVTYSKVVNPIIQSKCAIAGCHVKGSSSGYDYTTIGDLQKVAKSGQLLKAINHTGSIQMPKDAPKLDDCTIAKITIWVREGALEN